MKAEVTSGGDTAEAIVIYGSDEEIALWEQIDDGVDRGEVDEAYTTWLAENKATLLRGTGVFEHVQLFEAAADQPARDAHQEMLDMHVRLIPYVVNRFAGRAQRVSGEDLAQEAWVALSLSLWKWDPLSAGVATYAIPRIHNHLKRYLAYHDFVSSVPPPRVELTDKLRRKKPALLKEAVATHDKAGKLARYLGSKENAESVIYFEHSVRYARSLDEAFGRRYEYVDHDGQPTVRRIRGDITPLLQAEEAVDPLEQVELAVLLPGLYDELARLLSERELKILNLRYGLSDGVARTLEQVGREVGGITRSRVRQIEQKILSKLRKSDFFLSMISSAHEPKPQLPKADKPVIATEDVREKAERRKQRQTAQKEAAWQWLRENQERYRAWAEFADGAQWSWGWSLRKAADAYGEENFPPDVTDEEVAVRVRRLAKAIMHQLHYEGQSRDSVVIKDLVAEEAKVVAFEQSMKKRHETFVERLRDYYKAEFDYRILARALGKFFEENGRDPDPATDMEEVEWLFVELLRGPRESS